MCLLRMNLPNMCPNITHVDALDFSEWHSEEVISFFWRSSVDTFIYPGLADRWFQSETFQQITRYYRREFVTYEECSWPTARHYTAYCMQEYNTNARTPRIGELTGYRGQRLVGQSQCENFPLAILIAVPLTGSKDRSPAIYSDLCFLTFSQFLGPLL